MSATRLIYHTFAWKASVFFTFPTFPTFSIHPFWTNIPITLSRAASDVRRLSFLLKLSIPQILHNHLLLIMSAINRIFCSRQTKLFCHPRTKIIAAERNFFCVISYFVKSLINTCPKDCLRCPGLARYHPFLDGTLSLQCTTSRYLMSLKYET